MANKKKERIPVSYTTCAQLIENSSHTLKEYEERYRMSPRNGRPHGQEQISCNPGYTVTSCIPHSGVSLLEQIPKSGIPGKLSLCPQAPSDRTPVNGMLDRAADAMDSDHGSNTARKRQPCPFHCTCPPAVHYRDGVYSDHSYLCEKVQCRLPRSKRSLIIDLAARYLRLSLRRLPRNRSVVRMGPAGSLALPALRPSPPRPRPCAPRPHPVHAILRI